MSAVDVMAEMTAKVTAVAMKVTREKAAEEALMAVTTMMVCDTVGHGAGGGDARGVEGAHSSAGGGSEVGGETEATAEAEAMERRRHWSQRL